MIFAQANRYLAKRDVFSQDDRQGASVAHATLLRAVLTHSSVESVELFAIGASNRLPQANPEFVELCEEFPHKSVRLRNFDELRTLPPGSEYVFYGSGPYIAPLAQIRRTARIRFPICSLTHAVDLPLALVFLPGAFLLCEPSDVLITSSQAGKQAIEELIKASKRLLTHECGKAAVTKTPRVEIIPLGVDTTFLSPRDKLHSREVLRLPPASTILLYAGRLSDEHKADLEPLLVVFRELLRKTENLVLLIAGHDQDSGYLAEIEAMATRFGIRHKLRIIVNFQDFLKPVIYSAADILVSPSDNIQETFGLSIIEAMACGLPVVASDWSGYRELVTHGKTGFLIPTLWNAETALFVSSQAPLLPDHVRRHLLSQRTVVQCDEMYRYLDILIGNPELRKTFGTEGTAKTRAYFSWPTVIDAHQRLWEEVWADLRAMPPNVDHTLFDDWDSSFRHFATSVLDPSVLVQRSSLRADIDDALKYRSGKAGYGGLDPAELRRIFERASIVPISVRQLIQEGTASDTQGIMWLLKKGYMKCCPTR